MSTIISEVMEKILAEAGIAKTALPPGADRILQNDEAKQRLDSCLREDQPQRRAA